MCGCGSRGPKQSHSSLSGSGVSVCGDGRGRGLGGGMEEGQVEGGGGKVEGLIHKTFTIQYITIQCNAMQYNTMQ